MTIHWCNAGAEVCEAVVGFPLDEQLLLHVVYCILCLFIDRGDSFMAAIPLSVENCCMCFLGLCCSVVFTLRADESSREQWQHRKNHK